MFVPGIPKDLHISSPEQLHSLIGKELWECGQGGVLEITIPRSIGRLVSIEDNRVFYTDITGKNEFKSLLDLHVISQTYNNWYLCDNILSANIITAILRAAWRFNPKYEESRRAYAAEYGHW